MQGESDRVHQNNNNYTSPQLQGIVIITLPPPDNPSIGKTISAFTLSNPPPPPPPTQPELSQHRHHHHQPPLSDSNIHFSSRRLLSNNPILILGLLGVSLIALLFYISASAEANFELHEANDDNDKDDKNISTFVFPLYPKKGVAGNSWGSVEVKSGRSVEQLNSVINAKLMSSEVDSAASTILPVRGNVYPDGLYYTYMVIGNPPRPYFLDVDTGSDLSWIQCDAPCNSCAKGPHPFYKPRKENIISPKDSYCLEVQQNDEGVKNCETCDQCDYEIKYADHSSSMGVLARDELHLMVINGTKMKANAVFGCAYDQQGMLLNSLAKTDGILGLSRAKISLPSQLADQGIIQNVLGHCLTTDVNGGGYGFLGNDFVPHWQMAWVPMLNTPFMNFYHTELMKLSYGGKQLSLGGTSDGVERLVFDSGSSYTYFAQNAYNDLLDKLKDVSGGGLLEDAVNDTLPVCWQAKSPIRSVSEVKQLFKPLNFQFGSKWWMVSTKLQIRPEGYLITSNKGNVCLGILDGSKVHDASTMILGDISLRGQLFVYDNVKRKIGWIRSSCDRPRTFESHPDL